MSKLLDNLSEYLAHRKGLLPIIGMLLIIFNLILQIILPYEFWIVHSNLFLHIGLLVSIFGLLLAWAL